MFDSQPQKLGGSISKVKWGWTHRLLYDSQHTPLDVGDGLRVDGRQLVHQPVVEGQQGEVEEQTLPHRLLRPRCRHLWEG